MRPRAARRATGALATALALASVTGCASAAPQPTAPPGIELEDYDPEQGNGLWLAPDDQLRDLIVEAARGGGSVHVTGTFTETTQPDPEADPVRGRTLSIDLRGHAGVLTGQLSAGAAQATVVIDEGSSRVRGNAAYAESIGSPGTADTVVCTVGAEPLVDRWAPMLDPVEIVAALLEGGELSVAAPAGDEDVLEVVIGEGEAPVGVMTVERFGPALPRTFTAADQTGDAVFTFAEWGVEPDLAAAAAALPCPEG
ncbi:hypothetical protein ABIQ69_04115 [Agromyces sp. G08B096]|uniref:Lipoprotein LprG n=1 Tax=Agromyces sp. G08B096 TaxID=3156399 RepID=A0AAU7WA95_9MICO